MGKSETITLIFKVNEFKTHRFNWNTRSVRHSLKVIKLQKQYGDPIEIIGKGKFADHLRAKFDKYYENPEDYHENVYETASQLGDMPLDIIKGKVKRLKKYFR